MPFLTVEQDALHIFGTRTTASSVGGMVLPAFGSKGLKLEVSLNRVHWQPERAQGKYLLGGQALAFVSHHERLLVAQMNPAEKSYLLSHPSEVNNARSLSKFLSGVTLHGDIPF